MALVTNLATVVREEGLDASWDLPVVTFPERLSGLIWEVREGHDSAGVLVTSDETSLIPDRIKGWARTANNDRCMGLFTEDGYAYWWGEVGHHYTGTAPVDVSVSLQTSPVRIELEGVVDIVHGPRHTLLLTATGDVYGYGMATQGELAGTDLVRNIPYDAPELLASSAVAIAVSGQRSFYLTSTGSLMSFGDAGNQSGRGTAAVATFTPTEILTGVTLVDANPHGGGAWAPSHTTPGLYAWGVMPEVGDPAVQTYYIPATYDIDAATLYAEPYLNSAATTDLTTLTVSPSKILMGPEGGFLLAAGVLYPWGSNLSGELGLGTTNTHLELNPDTRAVALTDVAHAVLGRYQALAVRHDIVDVTTESLVYRSGLTAFTGTDSTSFVQVSSVEGNVPAGLEASVAVADGHIYWISDYTDGTATAQGDNDYALRAWDALVHPEPLVALPSSYRSRGDLPVSLSVNDLLTVNSPYRALVHLYSGDGTFETAHIDATTLEGWLAPVLTLTPGDRELVASWTQPGQGDNAITGYHMQVTDITAGGSTLLLDQEVDYTDTGGVYETVVPELANLHEYSVRVRPVTGEAETLPWGTATVVVNAAPVAPTGVTGRVVPGSGVYIQWTPPASHPIEGQMDGYDARLSYTMPDLTTGAVVVALPSSAHQLYLLPLATFNDGGELQFALDGGASWTIAVRGKNSLGDGAWSAETEALTLGAFPAQVENFQLTENLEHFTFVWDSPVRENYTGFRLQYRPYGDGTWTTLSMPAEQRSVTITGVQRGILYQVQVVTLAGALESAPASLQVSLRELDRDSITFRAANTEVTLPMPNSAELQIPGEISPILTQSGFYLPTQAIDDMEAVWSLRWSALPQSFVDPLENLQQLGTLTMNDILGMLPYGYIEALDYQGIPGAVDAATGEPLYQATAEFRVIRMVLPPLLGNLPEGRIAGGTYLGIASQGTPPLQVVRQEYAPPIDVVNGAILSWGGVTRPWGSITTPTSEIWDRSERTTGGMISYTASSWLELDASTINPEIGTVFLGVAPDDSGGIPVEVQDDTALDPVVTSARGAYYGYWAVEDSDEIIQGLGACTIRHTLVNLDIDVDDQLPLGTVETVLAPKSNQTSRWRLEIAAVTRYFEQLPYQSTPVGRDVDGQERPGPGLYVRRDTRSLDGRLIERRYLPAQSTYDARNLYPTTAAHNQRIYLLGSLAGTVRAELTGGTVLPYGANLTQDMDGLFSWLDREGPDNYVSAQDARWTFGLAGTHERVIMGNGEREAAGWLVYALDRSLIVEFWDASQLVFTRQLDLSAFIPGAATGDRFLVALGYDYVQGRAALGVSRRGRNPMQAYKSWNAPALKGHGYRYPTLYFGAVPVNHDFGTYMRTCWSWIRPVDRGFTRDTYLSAGSLAALMEHIP